MTKVSEGGGLVRPSVMGVGVGVKRTYLKALFRSVRDTSEVGQKKDTFRKIESGWDTVKDAVKDTFRIN